MGDGSVRHRARIAGPSASRTSYLHGHTSPNFRPRGSPIPAARLTAQGQRRVDSMIQLVIQVFPPSTENACSQWADSAVMPDQIKRTRDRKSVVKGKSV